MSAESFIDTNVFIYQLEALDEAKADVAAGIIRRGIESGDGCISFQVVQECLNTVLRKAEIPLDTQQTHAYLDSVLAPLVQIPASIPLYHRCFEIQARYGYAFYDALIIAAALQAQCTRLYSEDLQHGQRIEGLTIENPFIDSANGA